MNQLPEPAIGEIRRLPEAEQDATAAQIADDRAWDESFARTQDQLARWAERVRQDTAAGRVRPLSRRRP